MILFVVYGIDKSGDKLIDGFEMENEKKLIELLDILEIIPLKIWTLSKVFSPVFRPTLKNEYLIELLTSINISLKAGIPLSDSFKNIIEDTQNAHIRKVAANILLGIMSGESLSQSAKQYEKVFTPTIINLISIGEETGKVNTTLNDGAEFLAKVKALKDNLKQAMIYPLLSIVFMFLAIAAWMIFVVPKLVEFFEDANTALPPLTVFLINTSDFLVEHIYSIVISLIIISFTIRVLFDKSEKFRVFSIKFLLLTPVISQIIKSYNIAYITEYLRLAVSSGISLYDGLKILHDSIKNELYKNSIGDIITSMEQGDKFSTTLKENPLYPKFVVRVSQMGEETGSLEESFTLLSKEYYDRVTKLATTIPKVFQTFTLIITGFLIGLIILGIMGPIYELIGNV